MKKLLATLLACAMLSCFSLTSPSLAAGERTFHYDASLRMTFGLGFGKKAVRDEDFGTFARDVLFPSFKDGCCMFDARGQWVHPDRGLIQERNVVVLVDYKDGPDALAAQEHVAREFLKRFPGSNASVYLVRTPGIRASILYQ